jgi:hypothetical protein
LKKVGQKFDRFVKNPSFFTRTTLHHFMLKFCYHSVSLFEKIMCNHLVSFIIKNFLQVIKYGFLSIISHSAY